MGQNNTEGYGPLYKRKPLSRTPLRDKLREDVQRLIMREVIVPYEAPEQAEPEPQRHIENPSVACACLRCQPQTGGTQ